ncbi:anhydro-N-acetylmuramic acid kinase AnmK [Enterococcus asini]|uniref:anhydro-N-acetylmuramic acid kinase AnmK n=1 Tax=Enterococcus asini TaxID=57732 RepID=UPI00288F859B|nr:anhydro-N-acetylmuramic acid kinase AnmK [Enterococcus asini]MDT2744616.1 anhydro-N-acetylmuramic acid kinase AnmK [Enterococcus asini]MDT2764375.1 anhydro-N-acetylmuramic acid kinase AnmK [Enterococcus asini]
MYAVGLMSGTSLDGVDAALVEIEGVDKQTQVKLLDFMTLPFEPGVKERISQALVPQTSDVQLICSLNFELAEVFANAVLAICRKNGLASQKLDFVASHGQTIYHQPHPSGANVSSTLQIGEAAIIAERTQTTIISDFRYRDMAVGGQGAPIVPFSEIVLYQHDTKTRLLQNIGGIGNVTVLPPKESKKPIFAFDTGPGNMVIDELCRHFYEKEYDDKGQYAARGKVIPDILEKMMSHSFIQKMPPKSTGREDFGVEYVEKLLTEFTSMGISQNDWIATATAFTVNSILRGIRSYWTEDAELILGGGGSYNGTLVKMLRNSLGKERVLTQEDLGFSSEAKEAIAMAVLGNQTLQRRPGNVPSATGASKAVILGKITYYE